MAMITIPISDDLRDWTLGRVNVGDYASEADYVRALIEQDRADAVAALETALEQGRASGVSGRTIARIIADERARLG